MLGNKLVTLVLRNNKFRSSVPDEVSSYFQLERFDISGNTFVGPFQLALLSLPSITYLNISGNKLSGMLFDNISCNSGLEAVDLSSNLLTGRLPKPLVSDFNNDRIVLYGGNCLEETNQNQHEFPFCHTEALAVGIVAERKKQKVVSKAVVSIGIVGGIIGGLGVFALIFFIVRRENAKSIMKNASTTFISENAASGYTSKLISDSNLLVASFSFFNFQMGSAMKSRGVNPGDHCGIYGSNCPEWIIAMEACNSSAVTYVPLYDTLEHIFKLGYLEKGLPQHKAAPLFDRLVFDKTKQALGGRVRILLSGAAPLPSHVEEFLRVTSGSTLSQGYGLTESCAGCFTAIGDVYSMSGTVGVPMTTIEARLGSVPEMGYDALSGKPRGEICLRGTTLFSGSVEL